MEQPKEVFQQTEEISLHYPFPRSSHTVIGSWDTALARIKQTRSGKPHVTGTLPLSVKPDEGEEIPEDTETPITAPVLPAVPQALSMSTPVPKAVAETQALDEDKEQEKKRRRKERRLARKAKKAQAEGTTPEPTASSPEELPEPESDADDFEGEGADPEDGDE
jgi:hypothetical protein